MKCYKIENSEQLRGIAQYAKDERTAEAIECFRKAWSTIEKIVPPKARRVVCFVSISKSAYIFARLPAWDCTKKMGDLKKTVSEYASNNLEMMCEEMGGITDEQSRQEKARKTATA